MIMASSAGQCSGRWSDRPISRSPAPQGSQEACVNRIGQLRDAVVLGVTLMTMSGVASARQATDLLVAQTVVTPGAPVAATVVGPPGDYFVVLGSPVGAGLSFGGQNLAVGTDYAVVAS